MLVHILIHTSVKLVTENYTATGQPVVILIHTSVKLVTLRLRHGCLWHWHFNPHEREARDDAGLVVKFFCGAILIHTSVKLVTFWRRANSRQVS